MKLYYEQSEYETNRHKIIYIWLSGADPELIANSVLTGRTYNTIIIDEIYNPIAFQIADRYSDYFDVEFVPAKYCVNNDGQIVNTTTGNVVPITPNPQKESYKLSVFAGATPEQIDTYIENNITSLVTAKEFLKKLTRVVQLLLRETRMED